MVSIHAPARGATTPRRCLHSKGYVSIHAPARGATTTITNNVTNITFQSTRPHGARRGMFQLLLQLASFNPRARTGRDAASPIRT